MNKWRYNHVPIKVSKMKIMSPLLFYKDIVFILGDIKYILIMQAEIYNIYIKYYFIFGCQILIYESSRVVLLGVYLFYVHFLVLFFLFFILFYFIYQKTAFYLKQERKEQILLEEIERARKRVRNGGFGKLRGRKAIIMIQYVRKKLFLI